MVGMRGLEPPASASRTLRASQAAPHPVIFKFIISLGEVGVNFNNVVKYATIIDSK